VHPWGRAGAGLRYGAAVGVDDGFLEALSRLGFVLAEERTGRGARLYQATPNRYMTYTVHAYPDGTALFSWEFAIVDYLATRAIALGSSESLNTFMYPATDEVGPQEPAWLTSVLDRTEAALGSLDFADPEAEGGPAL
jgi:hypothetical protein